MPAHSTNKTNLGTVKTSVATLKTNSSLGTGDSSRELYKLARRLQREIATYEKAIQGLAP